MQLFDTSVLPVNKATIVIDGKLLVTDNLETHVAPEDIDEIVSRFPMRMTSSCLMIVVQGEVKFCVNFRDFVASGGSCAFINEGTIIENAVFNPSSRVILLSFVPGNFPAMGNDHQRNVHRLYALQVALVELREKHIDMLKSVYGLLRTILTDQAFASNRDIMAANCIDLMGNIIEQGVTNNTQLETKTSRKDEIVARFLESVNKHYREHRELSFYANELCLSLKYMSHVVYGQTGRHPSQWIKDYVILDAKTMLRSGRYTVQQVADELHFPNQSFFGKYFKEAVGVSPKKWK